MRGQRRKPEQVSDELVKIKVDDFMQEEGDEGQVMSLEKSINVGAEQIKAKKDQKSNKKVTFHNDLTSLYLMFDTETQPKIKAIVDNLLSDEGNDATAIQTTFLYFFEVVGLQFKGNER